MSTSPAPRTRSHRAAAALLAALVALTTLAVSTTPASAEPCPPAIPAPFTDVGKPHPFCREIAGAASNGFVNGYADGTYRPANLVTRQAAAAILFQVRYHDVFVAVPPCVVPPFPDVPVDHPFCEEIRDLADAGVFTGYADGTFRPGAPMSRLAMAMVLSRFPDGPVLIAICAGPPFGDVPTSHPQCAQIKYVKDAGILNGYADGEFKPGNGMTRQAFAAVALRTWNHITP